MSLTPPQNPVVAAAMERFAAAAASPCSYRALGLTCLQYSDGRADSWDATLRQMRSRTPEPIPHVPCLACEARMQLSRGPWGPDQSCWNGRAR